MKLNKIILTSLIILISFSLLFQVSLLTNEMRKNQEKPSSSGIVKWAYLDLYDYGINNTRRPTGSDIILTGRLYNPHLVPAGKEGYTVIAYVDGTPYSSFNSVTDENGDFNIVYTIDPFLDPFVPHVIEVFVDNPPGEVVYTSYYNILLSTTCYFELNEPTVPKMLGETFEFEGYLRYENGQGIPFVSLNYAWYDGPSFVSQGTVLTSSEGEINDIYIPDWAGDALTLRFNYSNNPYVEFSQGSIINTELFSEITCDWDLPDSIIENRQFRIQGQVLSLNNPSISISSRSIRILYNSSVIANVDTDSDGYFDYTHQLLNGTGVVPLEIEMDVVLGTLSTGRFIDIEVAPPTPPPPSGPGDIPFMAFFSIFVPIAVGAVVGLGVYGFYRYKKNEKESRVVNLPLEDRILNLKILKESGRLEESLSYLFNAIYMDLIEAKYGRSRKNNETIRDFAIISVTQLNLNPTSIYPFIQKVEEIIYAKPFQITDKDFYNTIELFSPIYNELTGYNFIINF